MMMRLDFDHDHLKGLWSEDVKAKRRKEAELGPAARGTLEDIPVGIQIGTFKVVVQLEEI